MQTARGSACGPAVPLGRGPESGRPLDPAARPWGRGRHLSRSGEGLEEGWAAWSLALGRGLCVWRGLSSLLFRSAAALCTRLGASCCRSRKQGLCVWPPASVPLNVMPFSFRSFLAGLQTGPCSLLGGGGPWREPAFLPHGPGRDPSSRLQLVVCQPLEPWPPTPRTPEAGATAARTCVGPNPSSSPPAPRGWGWGSGALVCKAVPQRG